MHSYSDLLKTILENRGVKGVGEINSFLNPNYERDILDPFLMRDMERACVKLFEIIDNDEKTIIYSDYDCDGIPGAVLLEDLFKKIGYKNYEIYIPGRNSEGYGLNSFAVSNFIKKEVRLIITIDLGITAVDEIGEAEVGGIDVIVIDHHLPHEKLPKAYAILNPKVDDYKEKMLCGAGVAFKFVQGFLLKYREYFKIKEGQEKWMLDMAGLATLSDLVPLIGENRAIAYFGMKVLRKSPRPGFQKLLSKMRIDQKYLTEDDIGFMITPKLNAASRMDDPMKAYELLSTDDEVKGGILADYLTKINDDRKNMVASIMREITKKFKKNEQRKMKEVIVIGSPDWRVGVLGLVANKISEEHSKPVFVWGKDENDCIKGSCRSDGSVSLVELMTETKDFFSDFGGHEFAGGFTVLPDKIHFLEDALSSSYKKVKRSVLNEDTTYDIKADLSLVTIKNWKEIERLAPFGLDNPKPIFLFENLKVENIKKFGKNGGEHIELTLSDLTGSKVKAISFFSGEGSFGFTLSKDLLIKVYATFDLSRFGGKTELRLRIVDLKI